MQGGKTFLFSINKELLRTRKKQTGSCCLRCLFVMKAVLLFLRRFFVNKVWRMKREESESEFTQEVNRSPSAERCCGQCVNVQWTTGEFRYIKIQPNTIDLRTRPYGIHKLCSYSPERCSEVYCFRLYQFNISSLVC